MDQATAPEVDSNGTEKTRQDIEKTRSALTDKLNAIHDHVVNTAQTVRSSVEQTIHDAKQTVHEGVQSVKNSLDLKQQAKEHPWPMVGGAIFAGVVLANWTSGRRGNTNGNTSDAREGGAYPHADERPFSPLDTGRPAMSCGGVKEYVRVRFKEELHQIQTVAIGAAAGLCRDWLRRKMPALAARVEREIETLRAVKGT